MPSLPSRNWTLTIAVKKHAKLYITFLKSCPILLYFFKLCQIFWQGLYEETNFGRNLAHSPSHLNFWVFSVTSKHLSSHDPNIKQASFVKSSKFNGFVLALFCSLGSGQNLHLEKFQFCWLVVFWRN